MEMKETGQSICEQKIERFAGGNGTKEKPYRITLPVHLSEMAELVEKSPDIFAKAYYLLTADIETDADFKPIGNEKSPFVGSFDGGIYNSFGKIVGRHCITLNSGCSLFGYIRGENGSVCVSSLELDGKVDSPDEYVGAVAEYLSAGIIQGVMLKDGMSVHGSGYAAGGITGGISGGLVKQCISYARVSGAKNAGGISGYSSGLTEECCNAGFVEGSVTVGGIVGVIYRASHANSYIENCLNVGRITSAGDDCIKGSIAGKTNGASVHNCCGMVSLKVVSGDGIGRNYYYSDDTCPDTCAIRKTAEEFEDGSVTMLLNEVANLWDQGTIPDVEIEGVKVYSVLRWINRDL